MKFARIVFLVAGIYGLLVVAPQYFLEAKIGRDTPPPITHPEFFYGFVGVTRSEEHTSELQSLRHLVCRLLLEKKIDSLLTRPLGSFFQVLTSEFQLRRLGRSAQYFAVLAFAFSQLSITWTPAKLLLIAFTLA